MRPYSHNATMSTTDLNMAAARYPINYNAPFSVQRQQEQNRADYLRALDDCRRSPAYHIVLPGGDRWACRSEPFMPDDTKGWTTIKRRARVEKMMTDEELDAEEDTNAWDDIVHHGRVTYTQAHTYEHNGSLFDLGARF